MHLSLILILRPLHLRLRLLGFGIFVFAVFVAYLQFSVSSQIFHA